MLGKKTLRSGYTTGSCAAAAAKAASILLLTGQAPAAVRLMTPKGIALTLEVASSKLVSGSATCAIQKDSGDDPDITDGVLVYATVSKAEEGIHIDGGKGIGRVTKPGLNQPVGAAAINTVPRQMIQEACLSACAACDYHGGLSVLISIPDGEALAQKTFNPRLGIVGGLSIIGTTGIVEPMSHEALIETIRLELRVLAKSGEKAVLIAPGNYGEAFARDRLGLDIKKQVLCSNFIGLALEAAVDNGFERILLVGHIGKLVKLGIGITNTHSAHGDGRMETLIACALESGAGLQTLRKLLSCATTDAALEVLLKADALAATMDILKDRIQDTLSKKVPKEIALGFICFSSAPTVPDILLMSDNAQELMRYWRPERGAANE